MKTVYKLSDGATTGIFLDIDSMLHEMRPELEQDQEVAFTILKTKMSEEELLSLGEFTGF